MCYFTDSTKNRQCYLIGGYIVQTNIPIELLRGTLYKYEVINELGQEPDLEIYLRLYEGITNTRSFLGVDDNSGNGLEYYYDKEKIIFKNSYNRIVKYCELIKKNDTNYKLEIITDEIAPYIYSRKSNLEVNSDITYSLRDGVYIFLSLKGKLCLHSCGMTINDKGILIIGSAGSGKSYYSKLLFSPQDDDYIGEDVNICTIEENQIIFTATPWCKKNNNRHAIAQKIVLLESHKRKNLTAQDVYLILYQSEFSFSWLPRSTERIRKYSEIIVNNGYTVISL